MSQEPHPDKGTARLLAIVEVDHDQRVRCGQPGCGHSVYKAIHVVQDGGELLVLGSKCFNNRYGSGALGDSQYGGGSGRKLTPDERELLLNNTQALLQRFEAEHQALREGPLRMKASSLAERSPVLQETASSYRPPLARSLATRPYLSMPRGPGSQIATHRNAPWPWMRTGTSMAGFKLSDGTSWVRVQHKDGMQMLAPWPVFDGWDEWLPSRLGRPNLDLVAYTTSDIQVVVAFMRERKIDERVSGLWGEIATLLS